MPLSSSQPSRLTGRPAALAAAALLLVVVLFVHGHAPSAMASAKAGSAQTLPGGLPRMAGKALEIAQKWQGDANLVSIDIDESSDFAPGFLFYSPTANQVLDVVSTGGQLSPLSPVSANASTTPLPGNFIDLGDAVTAAHKQGMPGGIKMATLDMQDTGATWTLQADREDDSTDPGRPTHYLFTVDALTGRAPGQAQSSQASEAQQANDPTADNAMRWMTAPKLSAQAENLWQQGSALYEQDQYSQALPILLQAAAAGHPRAMATLGNMYLDGKPGVPKDETKALGWYKQGAELGNRGAQYGAGMMYEEGDGVAADPSTAARYYTESARQGMPEAQFALGLSYEFGEGVTRNRRTAIYWLDQAAVQGDGRAKWHADWLSHPDTPQFKDEAAFGQYISSKVSAKVWREMAAGDAAPLPSGNETVYDRDEKADHMDQMGDHDGALRCANGGRC